MKISNLPYIWDSLAPVLSYIVNKTRAKVGGSCLKQKKVAFNYEKTINIYIDYEINFWNYVHNSDLTLGNSLFDATKLVKNADIDRYKNSRYGIGFDVKGTFSFPSDGFGKKAIIFGALLYEFLCEQNDKQVLDDTTLTAEKKRFN